MTISTKNTLKKKQQQQQNREHKTTYIKGQEQRFDQVSHIQGIYTSMVPRVFE